MGKKILLADDSITIQKVIELTFSDEDFEVVTVGNGRLAIEKLEEARPDIVLCDIIMPEKDGYEVCDFIKRNPHFGHVPVLLLTGAFEPFDQERAARVGCDGYLAKPFEPQALISKVKDLLSQAAARPRVAASPQAVAPEPAEEIVPASPGVKAASAGYEPVAVTLPSATSPMATPRLPAAFVPPEPEPERDLFGSGSAGRVPTYEPPPAYTSAAIGVSGVGTYHQPMELSPEPDAPPPPYAASEIVEDSGTEEPVVADPDELMPLMADEAATLTSDRQAGLSAEAGGDTSRTVMFDAADEPAPWSQPTVEVPLEQRAQATAAAGAGRSMFEPLPAEAEEPPASPETPSAEEEVFEPDFGEPVAAPPEPLLAEPPFETPPAETPPAASPLAPASEAVSFGDIRPQEPVAAPPPTSQAAEVSVPMEQVAQIAQRVVAQISERVVREVAWEVIPDLAEALIKKEIERLRAELEKV